MRGETNHLRKNLLEVLQGFRILVGDHLARRGPEQRLDFFPQRRDVGSALSGFASVMSGGCMTVPGHEGPDASASLKPRARYIKVAGGRRGASRTTHARALLRVRSVLDD